MNTLTGIDPTMPHFAVGGAVVHKHGNEFIIKRGDQIRFKYWGHTDVTFRGTDMRGWKGDFLNFRDIADPITSVVIDDRSSLRAGFEADFEKYIEKTSFRFIWTGVNKLDWIKKTPSVLPALANPTAKGWVPVITSHEKKLSRLLYEETIQTFIAFLMKKPDTTGQVIVEAATFVQDSNILRIYNDYMSKGVPALGLSRSQVRKILTCISFVTKRNRDTETQLADIGTHFLNVEARSIDKTLLRTLTPFEASVSKIFHRKGFSNKVGTTKTPSIKRV